MSGNRGHSPASLRRSIRTDRMRDLFDQAIAAGWSARRDGGNHIRMVAPGDEHSEAPTVMVISQTARAQGRGILNTEAVFKRWQREQEARQRPTNVMQVPSAGQLAKALLPSAARSAVGGTYRVPTVPDPMEKCPTCGVERTLHRDRAAAGTHDFGEVLATIEVSEESPDMTEHDEPQAEPAEETVAEDEGEVEPKRRQPRGMVECPECGAQMTTIGYGRHKAAHASRGETAGAGKQITFSIEEVLTVAEYAGNGGPVSLARLGAGLRLVARLRGGS